MAGKMLIFIFTKGLYWRRISDSDESETIEKSCSSRHFRHFRHLNMYHVISIASTAILLYLISYSFYLIGYYSLQFHRRLWNGLLATAFLVTAFAGLFI